MKSLFSIFFLLTTMLFSASMNENRKSLSSSSDTAFETPLSIFYDYSALLKYSKDKSTQFNKIYSYYTNYANSDCVRGVLDGASKITQFSIHNGEKLIIQTTGPTIAKTLTSPDGSRKSNCDPSIGGGDATGRLVFNEGEFSGKLTFQEIGFRMLFSPDVGLQSTRNGKPWTTINEKTILPLYGGLMMISTDGSNFTLYKGFWDDEGETAQLKYEKEVKYACGLIEKAKTLKGKKVSEAEARDFFKTVTPCAVAPKINAGTVIFDLQNNIVLGQRVVLNERASKEKSDSNSQQRLNY